MAGVRLKKNDTVVVISGTEKDKRGKVLSVDRRKDRVIVEGLNVRKKTMRRSPDNPQGGISEVECSIHASNLMLEDEYEKRQQKRGESASEGEGQE